MNLIALDIDWTQFIPEDRTLQTDAQSYELRDFLNDLRYAKSAKIVHNTGIPFDRVYDRMMGYSATHPQPVIAHADAVISNVGTEILLPPFTMNGDKAEGTPCREWEEKLAKACPSKLIEDVSLFLEGLAGLTVKQEKFPTPFKVTGLIADTADHGEMVARVEQGIARTFGDTLQLTFWSRTGFDITPSISGKGPALTFLMERWGLKPANVIVAGDSPNDLSMFEEHPAFRGIVPGNAMPELVSRLKTLDRENIYYAPKKAQGPAGVLCGLAHFGVALEVQKEPRFCLSKVSLAALTA